MIIPIEKNEKEARTLIPGYEGYQWKYMTAEKNPPTNDWLIENQENGDAFWVKTKKTALGILKYMEAKYIRECPEN